jgi:CRP-like cAMP-binding protein
MAGTSKSWTSVRGKLQSAAKRVSAVLVAAPNAAQLSDFQPPPIDACVELLQRKLANAEVRSLMLILRPFRFFDQFTDGQFKTLVKNLSLARFMPGGIIFRQHDPATAFSIVFCGCVRIHQKKSKVSLAVDPDSKGPLMFTLQPGDTLGSTPLITGRERQMYTAVSYREVVLLQISAQAFRNTILPVLCAQPHTNLSWHPETCRGVLQVDPSQRDNAMLPLLQQMLSDVPIFAQLKV